MYPATRSVTLRILPRSNATPTTVDRNVLVTLKVMSARAGVAPLGDHVAAVNDQSVRGAARLGRSDQRVVRRFGAELIGNRNGEILRVRILVRDGEGDGFVELRLVEARGRGFDLPPLAARRKVRTRIGRLAWRGNERQRCDERGDRDRRRPDDSRPHHRTAVELWPAAGIGDVHRVRVTLLREPLRLHVGQYKRCVQSASRVVHCHAADARLAVHGGFLGIFASATHREFIDADGKLFGLFRIDPIDDFVHLLSGIAGALVSWWGTQYLPAYFIVIGILYDLDAVVGMTMSRGLLDLSVFKYGPGSPDFGLTNWLLNLPHIVLATLALIIGIVRPGEPRAVVRG